MCRWIGSDFHDRIDYHGIAVSIEILEWVHTFSEFWGKTELNKLTSLPMCSFIAQLVEHRTGIAEVTSSNPVEALIFSGFFFPVA